MSVNNTGKILVVEDDVPIAFRLQSELQSFGYDVPDFATDAEEALRLAEQYQPILALVDIGLPGMDGVSLAQILKEKFGIRTVFITAYKDDATLQRALKTAPLDYLTKPVGSEALREAVEWALLDLTSMENEIRLLVPDYDVWLDAPHERLGGITPRESIGTSKELDLRRLLRAVVQGMPT